MANNRHNECFLTFSERKSLIPNAKHVEPRPLIEHRSLGKSWAEVGPNFLCRRLEGYQSAVALDNRTGDVIVVRYSARYPSRAGEMSGFCYAHTGVVLVCLQSARNFCQGARLKVGSAYSHEQECSSGEGVPVLSFLPATMTSDLANSGDLGLGF
jgi:hypothetical protein